MKATRLANLAPMLLALAVAACATTPEGEPVRSDSSSPDAARPPAETVPPLGEAIAPEGVPEQAWTAVLGALERELDGVNAADVHLVSVQAETWNDGSLGCPQPGEVYTQALVDGHRIVVEVDGEEFDFRVPSGGEPRRCESPTEGG